MDRVEGSKKNQSWDEAKPGRGRDRRARKGKEKKRERRE